MLGLYLLLGVVTLGVNRATRARPVSSLRQQVHAWWVLFPFITVSLLLYPLGPGGLVLLIGVLALRELATHHPGSRTGFVLMGTGVLGGIVWQAYGPSRPMSLLLPWLVVAQMAYVGWRPRPGPLLWLLFLILAGGLLCTLELDHLPLPPETRVAWLFYLFALTALNDIAQFVSGKRFGRQKIAPHISPNKTWQGLAGGMLASLLVSSVLGLYLQLAPWPFLMRLALVLSLGGFLGDLLFSAGKRFLGIKDFSQLIPGHGGILDRVDSLVLTAPLLYATLSAWPPA